MDVRAKFMKALIIVNKQGVMSRTNFSCCGSCASAELDTMLTARPKKIGGVHVNRQGWPKADEKFDICVSFQGANGNSTLDVGKRLFAACQEVGLHPDWDGTEGQCVMVGEETEEKLEREYWAGRGIDTEVRRREAWAPTPSAQERQERDAMMARGIVTEVRDWRGVAVMV